MSARLWPLVAACVALTFAATARADLPPPEANVVCEGRKIGQACELDGQAGACVQDSCSRNDYSDGVPPKTVTYDCPRCAVGETPSEVDAPAPEPAPEPEPIATPQPIAGPEPAADEPSVKASDSANKGGCAIAPTSAGGALLVALVGLLRRRRR
jgi:hypothetical protein